MKNKIHNLIEVSKEVLKDCSLSNGSIVAANTDKEYYPKDVQNYRYVWPRDVAFTLYAANIVNLDIQKPFIDWMLNRMEDFSESGMIFHRYATNGARDTEFGFQYQPDQSGALLWSLLETNNKLNTKLKKVINLIANSLCNSWNGKHFNQVTSDPWEERNTFPKLEGNFTYSLAACSNGLKLAYKSLGNKKWLKTSNEMKKALERINCDFYPRSWGKVPDKRIDSSVLGLIWPFKVVKYDQKLKKSLGLVKEKLMTTQGIMRYEHDEYDGGLDNLKLIKKGGGGWPLLTFWYHIALSETNQRDKAKELFENYIKNLNEYIPEQIFRNNILKSVSPLCWSHSMFIITSKKLGYF